MKILTIIGARPQFIKSAVISRAISELTPKAREVIVHTGQHFDKNMSDIFFHELNIPRPNYNLGIGGGSHGENTGRMIEKLEAVMLEETPDIVIVYGDTDSTLAGALSAAKLHIPIAHVESGLRSFNKQMPEEINRILTDHISSMLFAPTETALKNLQHEGFSNDALYLVGDVMYDATLYYRDNAKQPEWFHLTNFSPSNFVLATIHRAENTDNPDRLAAIFKGLVESGHNVALPLHPRTRKILQGLPLKLPSRIQLVEPVGYLEMVWLESNCLMVATDSGGMQKEAYFHQKPCVTFRTETEWVELVENGWNRLASPDCAESITEALTSPPLKRTEPSALYGDGFAGQKIIKALLP